VTIARMDDRVLPARFEAEAGETELGLMARLKDEIQVAEEKAWKALAGYKFWMFGYFAARWVFLNGLGGFRLANPFRPLVHAARAELARRQALPGNGGGLGK
jgi:hypothetical protein